MDPRDMFKNYESLVKKNPLYKHVLEILYAGLIEADPYHVIRRYVRIKDNDIIVGDRIYRDHENIHVIGFGKASVRMAQGLYSILGEKITGGAVITPWPTKDIGRIKVLKGDHPFPGRNTLVSSKTILDYIEREVDSRDLVFILISGGGSPLFEIPVDELSIEDIGIVTSMLMKKGANIYELNTVRKHLSKVKGGKLLRYINSKWVVSLIISDVIGDRIDIIASGPTAPDPSRYEDALNIIKRYGLLNTLPNKIIDFLEKGVRGLIPETFKPGDKVFGKVYNLVVANNYSSLEKMREKAIELGYNPIILTPYLHGEARYVGQVLVSIMWSIAKYDQPIAKPAAIIAGGETTVTVYGKGMGGRNQELCLSIALEIDMIREDLRIVFACIDSDGIDGNSPAAGAIIDDNIINKARKQGLTPFKFLEENNSFTFFEKLGYTIYTGYTGINVNDFVIGLII